MCKSADSPTDAGSSVTVGEHELAKTPKKEVKVCTREWAQKKLGVGEGPLDDLIKVALIRTYSEGLHRKDVKRLAKLRMGKTYRSVKEKKRHKADLAVNIANDTQAYSIFMQEAESRQEVLTQLELQHKCLKPGQQLSGWCRVRDDFAHMLAGHNRYLLGVVGLTVMDAAKIVGVAAHRKAETGHSEFSFILQPIKPKKLKKLTGASAPFQTVAYVRR